MKKLLANVIYYLFLVISITGVVGSLVLIAYISVLSFVLWNFIKVILCIAMGMLVLGIFAWADFNRK